MNTSSLLYTILVIAAGYGQLVESQSDLEALVMCAGRLGVHHSNPGKSCRDIYEYNMASRGQSGYYWIKTDQVYKVYCDVELNCGGIRGGWMRIANVDTSQGDDCPNGWSLITSPQQLCKGSGNESGCYSTSFPNNRAEYTSICGKLHGYQQGSPSAFFHTMYPLMGHILTVFLLRLVVMKSANMYGAMLLGLLKLITMIHTKLIAHVQNFLVMFLQYLSKTITTVNLVPHHIDLG